MPLLVRKPLTIDENGVRIKKDGTAARKTGPKCTYKKSKHPALYIELSREGKFEPEIAAAMGYNKKVFNDWMHTYPEFAEAKEYGLMLCECFYLERMRAIMEVGCLYDRNQIELIKYVLARAFPKNWSDKQVPSDDKPISTLTQAQLLARIAAIQGK